MAITPTPNLNSTSGGSSSTNQTTLGGGANSSNSTGSSTGTGAVNSQQVYNPWQQQEQQEAGQAASAFLQTGNLPGTLGNSPVEAQAYADNFNRTVAPQLAAQYGAGSPAIASQEALGLEQLQAQEYQTGVGALTGATSELGNLGYNAVGQNQQQAQQQQQQSATTSKYGDWQNIQADLAEGATNQQGAFTWP